MTPQRKDRALGEVKRSSRRACLLDSMFSTLMLAKRFPMVPVLSSAAKMPFPGVAMYLAFLTNSSKRTKKMNLKGYIGSHLVIT